MRRDSDLRDAYRQHRDSVLRYVTRTFGTGPPDPDDAVQEAFARYATALAAEEIANPRGFLFRSARNFIIDQKRSQSIRAAFADDTRRTAGFEDELNTERCIEARQRWAILLQAIEALDERTRSILVEHRLHGISCAEIARRRRCSPTLVKSILARALVTCHRALSDAERS